MNKFLTFLLFACITAMNAAGQLTVKFPSGDGLEITADWYPVSMDLPVILLCHQNRFSRGEYVETALRLNKFGFNCLAIDQRVGDAIKGIVNETAAKAKAKGESPKFEDAEQDITAAINYLYEKYNKKIIVIGSSYSASLALKVAAENEKVLAVVAFSPGEYFESSKTFTRDHIGKLDKPVFLTSAKSESNNVTELTKDINSKLKVQYVPTVEGIHGSKGLWPEQQFNQEYWISLMSFLNKIKTL